MASNQDNYHHLLQVRNLASRGRSKAQMCLHKILCIISTIPYPSSSSSSDSDQHHQALLDYNPKKSEKRCVLDVDLNLSLLPHEVEDHRRREEEEEPESISSVVAAGSESPAVSAIVSSSAFPGKSSVGECDLKNIDESSEIQFKNLELEGGINDGFVVGRTGSQETVKNDGSGGCNKNGNLELLIEAARVLSGEHFKDEDFEGGGEAAAAAEEEKKVVSKKRRRRRKEEEEEEETIEDDVAPVVKSKRGRNQVLPYKYRDSVLEAFTRLPRHTTKRRSK